MEPIRRRAIFDDSSVFVEMAERIKKLEETVRSIIHRLDSRAVDGTVDDGGIGQSDTGDD